MDCVRGAIESVGVFSDNEHLSHRTNHLTVIFTFDTAGHERIGRDIARFESPCFIKTYLEQFFKSRWTTNKTYSFIDANVQANCALAHSSCYKILT